MEAPRILKSFLFVIIILVLFMIINILTSVSYLYRVDITHIQLDSARPSRIGQPTPTPAVHATDKTTQKPELASPNQKPNSTEQKSTSKPVPKPTLKAGPKPSTKAQKKSTAKIEPKPTPKPDPNARQDACNGCFTHNFTYLIQNKNICNSSSNGTIDLLMVILTIHSNVKQRNNIRASWASVAHNNTGNVRYAFLLGKTKDRGLMKSVSIENDKHGDILMEDFMDAYSNLTYKTIMAMKWASLFCSNAKFVMKTDDDMWVNVPELLKVLDKRKSALQNSVGGACSARAGPIRNRNSKWYASIRSYPHNSYPGFCSGTGYVTSLSVARRIYEVSPNIPFFHLEDVYVALCIKKLGMKLLPIPGFHNYRTRLDPCEMRSPKILTSHMIPTDFLIRIVTAKCQSKFS